MDTNGEIVILRNILLNRNKEIEELLSNPLLSEGQYEQALSRHREYSERDHCIWLIGEGE